MIALLLSNICDLLLCAIGGLIITDFLKWKTNRFDQFFLGLTIVNTYFTIYSIFYAVSTFSVVILFTTYSLYFIMKRSPFINFIEHFKGFIKPQLRNKSFYFLLCILFSSVLISLNYVGIYDTGLYHIQAINWITNYSAVPGLANLHSRFGFNPNIFSLFAGSSFTNLFQQPIYAVNLSVFSVFVMWVMTNIHEAYNNKQYNFLLRNVVLLGFVFVYCLKHGSLPTPDVVPMLLIYYILFRFTEIKYDKTSSILLFTLCIYVVTIKLTAVPILVIAAIIFFKYKLYKFSKDDVIILSLSILIVLPWLMRTVIYTGWLIFPFPSIDLFSFDWKMPLQQVINLQIAITGFARNHGPAYTLAFNMSYSEWVPIWLKQQSIPNLLLLSSSVLVSVTLLILHYFKKLLIETNMLLALSTALLGVVFWFVMAPAFRFGESFISISLVLPLSMIKSRLIFRNISIAVLYILLPAILIVELWSFVFHNAKYFPNLYLIPNKIERVDNRKLVDFHYFYIDGKVKCFYPIIGDRCFDMSLPCSTNIRSDVHLRGEGIAYGFRLESQYPR